MGLYLRLAWRNLWRHRRRTLLVVLAISFGLALMIFYDGFMAGFEQAIYGNAVKVLGGNIQIHASGYAEDLDDTPMIPLDEVAILAAAKAQPQVLAASRRINTGGLATSREGAFGVSIVGIEPEEEQSVSLVAQNTTAGRFLTGEDEDVLFIGKGLADAMNVEVGDRITLAGKDANEQMRQRTMTIGGIYDIGLPDMEKRTVYMSLKEAQTLYGLKGQVTEVAIVLERIGQEDNVIAAIRQQAPGSYEIDSWKTLFPEMKAAINSKSGVMNIFSVIIMMIAGIGIMNLLLMAVFERTREIGLMGAMGMKPGQITTIFMLEGALMGVIGVLSGIILGLAINLLIGRIGFDFSQFSSLTEYTALINERVYTTPGMEKIGLRTLTVLIISILAAYYPAREAARSEPAQALHYV